MADIQHGAETSTPSQDTPVVDTFNHITNHAAIKTSWNQKHIQKWKPGVKAEDWTAFEWPEVVNDYPVLRETCEYLKQLYTGFARLRDQQFVSTKSLYKERRKLRRQVGPRILLGLSHLSMLMHVMPQETHTDIVLNWHTAMTIEREKLLGFECVFNLYLPYIRQANLFGGEQIQERVRKAKHRGTMKVLDFAVDNAILSIKREMPSMVVPADEARAESELEAKKVRQAFYGRLKTKLTQGVAEWRMIRRYAITRMSYEDEEGQGILDDVVTVEAIDRHIAIIDVTLVIVGTKLMELGRG